MMSPVKTPRSVNFHYGWVIAFTGTAVILACIGLGRFALGMLLPGMRLSLELSYTQMGFISTGNFVGYMFAVAVAGYMAAHVGARLTISLGLVLVGITMILVGFAEHYLLALFLYLITGIGSGLSNVPLMGLVSHWFLKETRGRAAGIMLCGNGIAILCSGLYVPWINVHYGLAGWRYGWITMGVVVVVIAVMAWVLLRNDPKEKATTPMGRPESSQNKGFEAPCHAPADTKRIMVHLGLIYALFGGTYVVYATFIVTALVSDYGFSEHAAGNFWAVIGAMSILSGPLFGWFSDRLGRRTGMLVVYTLFSLAYGLVGMHLSAGWLYLSITIFGITAWSVPTIMAATVGDYLGPARAAQAFGFITLFFGVGQIAGPALAGVLADAFGTFRIAFGMCTAATLTAILLVSLLPKQHE